MGHPTVPQNRPQPMQMVEPTVGQHIAFLLRQMTLKLQYVGGGVPGVGLGHGSMLGAGVSGGGGAI